MHGLVNRLRRLRGAHFGVWPRDQGGKLAAANTSQQVLVVQAAGHTHRYGLEQVIACLVAQRIIDHFEPVQFDHHQGRFGAFAFERLGQTFVQHGPIGKFGNRIDRGQLVELAAHIAQLFGMHRALPVDQRGQQGQRDIGDEYPGQDGH